MSDDTDRGPNYSLITSPAAHGVMGPGCLPGLLMLAVLYYIADNWPKFSEMLYRWWIGIGLVGQLIVVGIAILFVIAAVQDFRKFQKGIQ